MTTAKMPMARKSIYVANSYLVRLDPVNHEKSAQGAIQFELRWLWHSWLEPGRLHYVYGWNIKVDGPMITAQLKS